MTIKLPVLPVFACGKGSVSSRPVQRNGETAQMICLERFLFFLPTPWLEFRFQGFRFRYFMTEVLRILRRFEKRGSSFINSMDCEELHR